MTFSRLVLLHGRFFHPYLKAMPTLATSQADDLKIEQEGVRVWLSRLGVEDGEPFDRKVTVETYRTSTGQWARWRAYQAWIEGEEGLVREI